MAPIAQIAVRHFRIPLAEVLADAIHGIHTHFELITTVVRLRDGTEGTGYTYIPAAGAAMQFGR